MADVALGRFKQQFDSVFLVIKGLVFPFHSLDLCDSLFLKCRPAVDAVQDYCCFALFIAMFISIIKDPLNFDWGKLSTDVKGFNIGADGFFGFYSPADRLIYPRLIYRGLSWVSFYGGFWFWGQAWLIGLLAYCRGKVSHTCCKLPPNFEK